MMWAAQQNRDMHSVSDLIQETATTARGWRNPSGTTSFAGDGSPDYHGWPDRYGFLPTSQAVFNPLGGPSDDLCVPDPNNPPTLRVLS
jgi:hypothetical protein